VEPHHALGRLDLELRYGPAVIGQLFAGGGREFSGRLPPRFFAAGPSAPRPLFRTGLRVFGGRVLRPSWFFRGFFYQTVTSLAYRCECE